MNTKKIVITGGPGSGKTSIIKALVKKGFTCFEEVSRQITLDARKKGIDQLFLTKPLLFSELLLKSRKQQFIEAQNSNKAFVFLDRGIPDILAYMNYIGDEYNQEFIDTCNTLNYDYVFILAPWQEIFTSDNERYENFNQAVAIYENLLKTYKKYNYQLINVPFGTIQARTNYVINTVKAL